MSNSTGIATLNGTMKLCKRCNTEKDPEEFSNTKSTKDGLRWWCKVCMKAYLKKYHADPSRKVRYSKRDKVRRLKLKESGLCRDCQGSGRPGKVCCQDCADARTRQMKKRRDSDICFKLATSVRTRLGKALEGGYKVGSAVEDLGCSIEEFRDYVASKFKTGMSWYNRGEWHLDHVKPLSSFDLEDRDEFLEAVHHTNYQPLWAEDNLRKGAG